MKLVNLQWCWPFALVAAATLFSCQGPPPAPAAIAPLVKPPLEGIDPAFTEWTFLAEEGATKTLPSGTRVCIPPYAFVDEAGQPVFGEVKVRYREMHDGLSIFLAGIPMEYQGGAFTTAGSFEIRADQQGKPVRIAEGNTVSVLMASFEEGDAYDFFYLDEQQDRAWEKLGTNNPLINAEKVSLKKKIAKMKPGLAFPLDRKYMAFNFNAVLDAYYKNDLTNIRETVVKRDMEAYGLGWVDSEVHEWIEFNGDTHNASLMVWKNLDGTAFPAWTKNRWGSIKQEKGNDYVYTIESKKEELFFSVRLRAVMPLSTLFAFPPEKWQTEYDAIMAKIEEEKSRMEMMGSVLRSFEVGQLGIYNWDQLMKEKDRVRLLADFTWPVEVTEGLNNIEVVLITGDNKGVIRYPQYSWDDLALVDDPGARLFAVLPGNRIAVYPPAEFRKIEFDKLRQSVDPVPYVFIMKGTSQGVKTEEEVRSLLEI